MEIKLGDEKKLHLHPDVRRPRAFDILFSESTQEYDERFHLEYGKSGTKKSPGEEDTALQPKRPTDKKKRASATSVLEYYTQAGKTKQLGATVWTDTGSDEFNADKGSKQGDAFELHVT